MFFTLLFGNYRFDIDMQVQGFGYFCFNAAEDAAGINGRTAEHAGLFNDHDFVNSLISRFNRAGNARGPSADDQIIDLCIKIRGGCCLGCRGCRTSA